jgi:hypothetical protein
LKHRINHLLALLDVALITKTPQGKMDADRLAHELWRAIEKLPVE